MDPGENSIVSALVAMDTGVSERKATKEYGISCSTLQSRRAGSMSSGSAHHHQQLLSPEQEKALSHWILEQEACGYAPSHARAREMATLILKFSGDTNSLGKKWVTGFTKRNPAIASIIGKPIESARFEETQPHHIKAFYELFDTIHASNNTQQADVWNMDEHSIGL